jgi:uncharacterized protein YecT (DUF1311 family)
MRVCAALLILFVPALLRAQGILPECESPQTTPEVNVCAEAKAQQAELELSRVFAELRAKVQSAEEELAGLAPSGALWALERAQTAWLSFRSTQCDFAYAWAFGGTARDAYMLSCRDRLNRARAAELRGILKGEII